MRKNLQCTAQRIQISNELQFNNLTEFDLNNSYSDLQDILIVNVNTIEPSFNLRVTLFKKVIFAITCKLKLSGKKILFGWWGG